MAKKNKIFHKKFNLVVIILSFVVGFVIFGICESPDLGGLPADVEKSKLMGYGIVGIILFVLATFLLNRLLFKTSRGKKSGKKRAIKTVAKRMEALDTYRVLKIRATILLSFAYLSIVSGTVFTFYFAVYNPDYWFFASLGSVGGYVLFIFGSILMGTRSNIEFCDLTKDFIEFKEDEIVFYMPKGIGDDEVFEFKGTPFFLLSLKGFEAQTLLAHNLGYDIFSKYDVDKGTFSYVSTLSEKERRLQMDRMDRLATGDTSVLKEMPSYYLKEANFYEIDYHCRDLGKFITREDPVYDDVVVEDVYHYVDDQLVQITSNYENRQVGTKKVTHELCHIKVAIWYKGTKKVVTDLKGKALKFEGDVYI